MADEDQSESPSSLREKLSTTAGIASNALARAVIAEEGLQYVKPDEFVGSDPTTVEDRARSLNAEREVQAQQALATLLKEKGVDDVDSLIGQGGGGGDESQAERQAAVDRTRSMGGMPVNAGTPDMSHVDPNDGGAQMMEHFRLRERGK